ncbi:MAG: hypothetical protein QM610_02815 [Chitinophagaceae bacterium]
MLHRYNLQLFHADDGRRLSLQLLLQNLLHLFLVGDAYGDFAAKHEEGVFVSQSYVVAVGYFGDTLG